MFWLRKVVEQHRDGRKHLPIYTCHVHFLCTGVRIPAILVYLPEHLITLYHAGTTGFVVLQPDKFPVTKFLEPVRDMLRHYVGVDVYFHGN